MAAGIVPMVTQIANDPIVQMKTTTFLEWQKWYGVWQMGMVLEVFVIAAFFWLLRPFIPFVLSRIWTGLPVIGVMTKVRNVIPLGGFTLRNGMYKREFGDNVLYFVKKYRGSYFFMDVPFDFSHIDRGFVQDPLMNKFVATLGLLGYKTAEALENAMLFNNIDPGMEDKEEFEGILRRLGFTSYDAAHSALNPSDLMSTSPLFAPKYSNVPMDIVLGYGADVAPGSIAAQISDMFEFQKPPIEEDGLTKWIPVIMLIVSMGIAAAIIMSQVR